MNVVNYNFFHAGSLLSRRPVEQVSVYVNKVLVDFLIEKKMLKIQFFD